MRKTTMWRWLFFVVGMLILALGITLTIKGDRLGIGPWDVLHVGLFLNFGLTIGTWNIITGITVVVGTALYTRNWPKFGTWINMVMVGVFIDFFNWLIPDVESLAAHTVLFLLGVVVMALGVGVYVAPNIGAGPRDALMLVLVEKTGMSIKKVRTTIEIIVALAGWMLGGPVGIGTVLIALLIGQLFQITIPNSRKLLVRVCKEENDQFLF